MDNFTSRCVIVPDQTLRIDQIIIPYAAAVELLQQTIINILQKSYNMSYNDAYNMWFMAQTEKDTRIEKIILSIIANYEYGIPVLLNRNQCGYFEGLTSFSKYLFNCWDSLKLN